MRIIIDLTDDQVAAVESMIDATTTAKFDQERMRNVAIRVYDDPAAWASSILRRELQNLMEVYGTGTIAAHRKVLEESRRAITDAAVPVVAIEQAPGKTSA